jgi:hypothetical protein
VWTFSPLLKHVAPTALRPLATVENILSYDTSLRRLNLTTYIKCIQIGYTELKKRQIFAPRFRAQILLLLLHASHTYLSIVVVAVQEVCNSSIGSLYDFWPQNIFTECPIYDYFSTCSYAVLLSHRYPEENLARTPHWHQITTPLRPYYSFPNYIGLVY